MRKLVNCDRSHFLLTFLLFNSTTWDEHLIELSFPKAAALGHIDFRFSMYQPCQNRPAIQVTLLKQNTSGFGYRKKATAAVPGGGSGATSKPNARSSGRARCFSEPNRMDPSVIDEEIDFNLDWSDPNGMCCVEYLGLIDLIEIMFIHRKPCVDRGISSGA